MGSQWDKPMKFTEWWAIRSQALQELVLTPAEWYRLFAGTNIDSAGTPQNLLNTSGYVTEASAATIQGNTAYTTAGAWTSGCELVAVPTSYSELKIYEHQFKTIVTLAAADGGGAVAATALIIGPAGYYPVMDGIMLYSTVADTFTATFSVTGGALVGPAAHSITTVASTVNTQLQDLFLYDLTDASAINIAISSATVGMVIVCLVRYHYET